MAVVVDGQDRYDRSGYNMEYTWHVVFGEPWIQPKPDIYKLCSLVSKEEADEVCYFVLKSTR